MIIIDAVTHQFNLFAYTTHMSVGLVVLKARRSLEVILHAVQGLEFLGELEWSTITRTMNINCRWTVPNT